MNKPEKMEERLWDYIDGLSDEQERSFISKMIGENHEWKEKYQELLGVQQLMQQNIELDEPSMRFSQNVMDAIADVQIAPPAGSYIKKSVIRGIAAFFIGTISILVILALTSIDWSTAAKQSAPIQMPDMNISKYLTTPVFYGIASVSMVLALALLDMGIRNKQKRNREMADH